MAKAKTFDTEQSLRANAEKLQAALDSIELHGDGEHSSTIQELARLSVALTSVCAEIRQHAKADRRALASYPLDQIIAHLKTLPSSKREDIAREVSGVDDEEPLL